MKAGKLTAVVGTSRSGKSAFVQSILDNYRAALIWDVKAEYSKGVNYAPKTPGELVKCCRAGAEGVIAFQPQTLDHFDFFCRVAQAWIKAQSAAGREHMLLIEETSDVTSPGKAPSAYGILLRRFLSYGVNIYAVTQRPAESDKTSIGNASQIHICRMTLPDDRKTISKATGVPLAEIEALRADQDAGRFDFISADLGGGKYATGVLTWGNNRPVFTPTSEVRPL